MYSAEVGEAHSFENGLRRLALEEQSSLFVSAAVAIGVSAAKHSLVLFSRWPRRKVGFYEVPMAGLRVFHGVWQKVSASLLSTSLDHERCRHEDSSKSSASSASSSKAM